MNTEHRICPECEAEVEICEHLYAIPDRLSGRKFEGDLRAEANRPASVAAHHSEWRDDAVGSPTQRPDEAQGLGEDRGDDPHGDLETPVAAAALVPQLRTPTERQYDLLIKLGSGSALLTGRKREIDPLLRRGWVTADAGYAWVRITALGLHALALAVEKYGLPEFEKGNHARRVCSDCQREWRPKCRCGGSSWRYEITEVERAAA